MCTETIRLKLVGCGVKGDFGGGPFVSHMRLDKANQRIIVAEIFIYSPTN